jgi:hypothetical protein
MLRLRASSGLTLLLAAALIGCSNPPPTDDVPDAVTPDGHGGMDVLPSDGMNPGDVVGDGGPTCRSVPIEDLNALGMLMNNTVSYMGDNRMARDSTTIGLQVPDLPASVGCTFRATRQRVFKYVTRTMGALRISTTNMGTDLRFDTTLVVISAGMNGSCAAVSTGSGGNLLACNDDDPTLQGEDRRISSLARTPILAMGATVYIAVGGFVPVDTTPRAPDGEQGMFQLTVQEIAPVADNMACDPRGLANVCGATSTCVPATLGAATGTCRANGSVAGAACATGGTCTAPAMCDGNNGRCFDVGMAGAACERFTDGTHRCATGFSCVNLQRGAFTGTCQADGTVAGSSCTTGGACTGAGLTCVPGTAGTPGLCLTAAPAGGACRTWDTTCATGQTCVAAPAPTGTPGTCTPNGATAGTDCNASGMCTGTALTCTMVSTTRSTCLNNPAAAGGSCGTFARTNCNTGLGCFLTNYEDRSVGQCRTEGGLGGACRTAGNPCDTGLVCTTATPVPGATGTCGMQAVVGGACQVFGQQVCPTDSTCVLTSPTSLMGTCTANGTVAGAACRATGTACDTGLTCTAALRGVCQRTVAAGAACDPRWATTACPTGQFCHATSVSAGTCAASGMEVEPNNSTPQMVTGSSSTRGALTQYDMDCYGVAVGTGQTLFARVNTSTGLCRGGANYDISLDLYDTAGRLLGGDNRSGSGGCPRINGGLASDATNYPWARNLPAGTYTLCVRNAASVNNNPPATTDHAPVEDYVLDVNVQ